MSELKEHLFCECDEIFREYRGQLSNEKRPYYLKSEADKVIAELEDKTLQYKVLYKEKCRDINTQERFFAQERAHDKYKRCLAMANYWSLVSALVHGETQLKCMRRELKWHKLADKFKEAK